MPETTENPAAQPPAQPNPAEGATPPATQAPEEQLGDAGKKAIAAERKRASEAEKQLADATKRLQELEDRDKSELEKAQARLTQFEKDLAAERMQRLRLEAASEHSIPAEYVDLLTATDTETLKVQAEKVAALVKTNASRAPLPGQGNHQTSPNASHDQAMEQLRKRGLAKAE